MLNSLSGLCFSTIHKLINIIRVSTATETLNIKRINHLVLIANCIRTEGINTISLRKEIVIINKQFINNNLDYIFSVYQSDL